MHFFPVVSSAVLLSLTGCTEVPGAASNLVATAAAASAAKTRPAVHAGSWYAADGADVRALLAANAAAPRADDAPIVALIGPHAGVRFSGAVAAKAYALFLRQRVARIFLIGPSHHLAFDGLALPAADLTAYATPFGNLPIDTEAVARLRGVPGFAGPASAHDAEHSLEMHAIFAALAAPGAKLVPLVAGRLGSAARVATLGAELSKLFKPGDVLLFSSDFTHYGPGYGYVPFSTQVPDRLLRLLHAARDLILRRDLGGFDKHVADTGDTICGHEPIRLALSVLPKDSVGAAVAEDSSGRMLEDYESSVSYLSLVFRRPGGLADRTPTTAERAATLAQGPQVLDAAGQKLALGVARRTLQAYLTDHKTLTDVELEIPTTGVWRDSTAVFVTLQKDGELRGCIGHIAPVEPLWQDIRDNAIAAATEDSRFPPVSAAELPHLELEVSVLTPPRAIPGADAFVVGRHGIILQARGGRAVFLPQVAPEQGWDRNTTLEHLSRKAGLPANAWQDAAARFEVFEAQVFSEN
ncbi:MAG: AmmeMemoRadiSam system protein A [Deltaproteobacteria bacterium]|nr:AmmeMemoRadiSam system protein A [Deltaproteobacteria bacterium]